MPAVDRARPEVLACHVIAGRAWHHEPISAPSRLRARAPKPRSGANSRLWKDTTQPPRHHRLSLTPRPTLSPMNRPTGLPATPSRDRLLDTGLELFLAQGYNDTGVQDVLTATGLPKGSFYHHFESKEAFGLEAVDRYMMAAHAELDRVLSDPLGRRWRGRGTSSSGSARAIPRRGTRLPLRRTGTGAVGGEPSVPPEGRKWPRPVAERLATCLELAREAGDLPAETDTRAMADLLVNCWEGAALRSRLLRSPAPLDAMLDFYFSAVAA